MFKDPIVEEVRRNREKLYGLYDYNINKYFEHIYEQQAKRLHKYISEPFKKEKVI